MTIKINDTLSFAVSDILFVFALEVEAGTAFDGMNKITTGIGKVNAAISLTKAIIRSQPKLIVNLGTAGSSRFGKGEIVCCNRFVQRDMDVTGLGFELYQTPFSNVPRVLDYGIRLRDLTEGTCGSGDSFVMNHRDHLYDVIDMEAYPLALIAMTENIPFLCLKYISDDAGSEAASDWETQVHLASLAFRNALFDQHNHLAEKQF